MIKLKVAVNENERKLVGLTRSLDTIIYIVDSENRCLKEDVAELIGDEFADFYSYDSHSTKYGPSVQNCSELYEELSQLSCENYEVLLILKDEKPIGIFSDRQKVEFTKQLEFAGENSGIVAKQVYESTKRRKRTNR